MTVPHCPSQNGSMRQKGRLECKSKWHVPCYRNLTYLRNFGGKLFLNQLPTKSHKSTQYQLRTNKKPDSRHIRISGWEAYTYLEKSQRDTPLDDKAVAGTFAGDDYRPKGYRIYTENNKLILAKTVKFTEKWNSVNTK